MNKSCLAMGVIYALCIAATGEIVHASVPLLTPSSQKEFLDSQERISGGATVGVVFVAPGDKITLDRIFVYFAKPIEDPVVMEVATVDGRYRAVYEYQPSASLRDWVHLDAPSPHRHFLDQYTLNEVAVTVSTPRSRTYFPVRWGQPVKTDLIRLYLNTEGTSAFFNTYNETTGELATRSCGEASARSRFKFNRVCDVPSQDLARKNEIQIKRRRGVRQNSPILVKVQLSR